MVWDGKRWPFVESVVSVEVDYEEIKTEEQSPEGPSEEPETDEDSIPSVSELASDREGSSTPLLERASSLPAVELPGKLCNTPAALSMSCYLLLLFTFVNIKMSRKHHTKHSHDEFPCTTLQMSELIS